jgi:hypothetical protein
MENGIKVKSLKRNRINENEAQKYLKNVEDKNSFSLYEATVQKNGSIYDIWIMSAQLIDFDTEKGVYFTKFLGKEYGGCANWCPFQDMSQVIVDQEKMQNGLDSIIVKSDLVVDIFNHLKGKYKEQKQIYEEKGSISDYLGDSK